MKKKLLRFWYIWVTLLVLAGVGVYFWINKASPSTSNSSSGSSVKNNSKSSEPKKTIRLIGAGDMLAHDAINQEAKTTAGYDYMPMMQNMKTYFDKADLRFCVQAIPGGAGYPVTGYPVFNAPVEFTRDMAKLGCNVINSGSNHSNDKGQGLVDATLNEWDKYPDVLAVAGANRSAEEQNKLQIFEKDGIKFAFLSYVTYSNSKPPNSYGVNMFNQAKATSELATARAQADIVLVSMRWGTEYSSGINSEQERLGKFLADNGADIVFGHGQHVQGPVKKLPKAGGGETVVWYGIGNFINAQLDPESLFNGIPIVDIDIASKKVTSLSFLPFYMHYEWTAQQKVRGDLLSRKNFMMYTFDQAQDALAKSQNNTSISVQKTRLTDVLNKYTLVTILEPAQY